MEKLQGQEGGKIVCYASHCLVSAYVLNYEMVIAPYPQPPALPARDSRAQS